MVETKEETNFVVGSRVIIGNMGENRGYFLGAYREGERCYTTCQIDYLEVPEIDDSRPHYHEIITEVTCVSEGELTIKIKDKDGMREEILTKGKYMIVEPGAIIQNPRNKKGTKVFVVKFPCVPEDKKYYSGNI